MSVEKKNMNNSPQENLGTQHTGNLLLRFAIPSIIGSLVSALYNVVDQIFIGQKVGFLGNAATSVVFPLFSISIGVSLLLGIGTSARFSILQGRKKDKESADTMGNGILSLLIIGIILSFFVELFCKPMLSFFGGTKNVLPYALTYTRIVGLGLPFLIISTAGTSLLRADSSPKKAMIMSISGSLVNVFLDYLFIFVFDWGMTGAAIATVCGYCFSALYGVYYLRYNFKALKFRLSNFFIKWKIIRKIFVYGMSPFLSHIVMFVVNITLNKSLSHYGALSSYGADIPLAVSGVIGKCNYIFMSISLGIMQGAQPIIGYNYGAKKFLRVLSTFKQAMLSIFFVGLLGFLSFHFFPHYITSIFGGGDEAYFEFSEKYLKIFLFFIAVNGMEPALSSFYLSIGKPLNGIFVNFIRRIVLFIPCVLIFPRFMGVDGILWAGFFSDGLAFLLVLIFIIRMILILKKEQLK